MTDWQPVNDAETGMRDALRAGDQEQYFHILAGCPLLLPVSVDAPAGRAHLGWGTWTTSGRTHVLAFTSDAALRTVLADNAGSARRLNLRELAGTWPNFEWWLAVNPGLPIEGYLPAWFVSQLARGDGRLPGPRAVGGSVARATVAVPGCTVPPDPNPDPPPPRSGLATSGWLSSSADTGSSPATGAPRLPSRRGSILATRYSSTGTPPHASPSPAAADPPEAAGAAPTPSAPPAGPGAAPVSPASPPARDQAPLAAPASKAPVPAPAPGTPAPDSAGTPVTPSGTPAATGSPPAVGLPAPAAAGPAQAPVSSSPQVKFTPANDVEGSLLVAAGEANTESFLSTLLLAKVLLPRASGSPTGAQPGDEGFTWRTESLDGEICIAVYTSAERLTEHLTEPVETVELKFAQLIRHWPDPAWSFAVNPNTPVGAKLPGNQIVALANWAAEAGLGDDRDEGEPAGGPSAPEAAQPLFDRPVGEPNNAPTMMQKTVVPEQVGYYLERAYDRVSGFVHRANEVAHLKTPRELFDALGLSYRDSPFAADAEEVHVLRWAVHRPSLYRIPYGGQNESAMQAMKGWVIERAPFRGNGFAPGESRDVIAEFKVDSVRLPHGAELWRIGADGSQQLVATLDSDVPVWRRVEEKA